MRKLSYKLIEAVEKTIPITLTIIERRTFDWHFESHEHIHEVVQKVGYLIVDHGDEGGSFLVPGERTRFMMASALYFLEACGDAQDLYMTHKSMNWNPHWNSIVAEMDAWNWWNDCLENYYTCIRWLHRLSPLEIVPPSDKQYTAHRSEQYITNGGALKFQRDTGVELQTPLRRQALEIVCAPCPNMDIPIEETDMTELQGYYLGDQNLPNEHFGDSPAEVITNAQHLSSLPDPDCWILQFDGDRLIDQWPLDHFRLEHLEPATQALETVEATA